nr:hypothetical protein [uncultured Actinoplanes sp.]
MIIDEVSGPVATRRSGVYVRHPLLPPAPATDDTFLTTFEQLRVDVDGRYPTMTVSGTISRLFGECLRWIARVTWDPARGGYAGPISRRDGMSALEPHTDVFVTVSHDEPRPGGRIAEVVYSGAGLADSVRRYAMPDRRCAPPATAPRSAREW